LALTPAALFYLCSTHNDKELISLGLAIISLMYLTASNSTAVAPTTTGGGFPEKPSAFRKKDSSTSLAESPKAHAAPPAPEEKQFLTRLEEHFVTTMDQFS